MGLMNRALKWGWLLYLRLKVASLLWRQRVRSGLTREQAALSLDIAERTLRNYEIGKCSPSLKLIAQMMAVYKASDSTIFLFCAMGPLPLFARNFLKN